MDRELIDPKSHRQLFLDDHAVAKTVGIKRTLHQPLDGGAIIRPDQSLGQSGTQTSSVPQWNSEKNLWEWWYYAHQIDGSPSPMLYSTSEDGVSWENPELGFYEWRGSKKNNIALAPGSEHLAHIIRDETDPDPQRRYKALFGSNGRKPAVSADGFEWTMLDVPPVPSADTSCFTYDPIGEQYVLTVKHGTKWGRSVWLSTAKKFGDFGKPELIFHTDEIDRENRRRRVREIIENPAFLTPPIIDDEDYIAEAYKMSILPYEGMYIGFPLIFNPFGAVPPPHMNFTRINQNELAISRDLRNWKRVADRAVFLGIQPWNGVNYGTNQISVNDRPILRDNQIWVYYNGHRMSGDQERYRQFNGNKELFRLNIDPSYFQDSSGLCLAKLDRDRFVSLDAAEVGWVVTKPFMWNGQKLRINADARWGEVHAEILDAETLPAESEGNAGPDTFDAIPGFVSYKGETVPMTGDHRQRAMSWNGDPQPPTDRPVQIRFIMRQARLYSFWLE